MFDPEWHGPPFKLVLALLSGHRKMVSRLLDVPVNAVAANVPISGLGKFKVKVFVADKAFAVTTKKRMILISAV